MRQRKFIGVQITLLFSLLIFLSACGGGKLEELEISSLVDRNGLYYKINEDKPFNGYIVSYWNKEENFKKELTTVKGGVEHGKFQSWFDNQQVHSIGEYQYGVKEGEWTYYYKSNGQPEKKGAYLDNKEHGVWSNWTQTGELISEFTYENGVKNGEAKLFDRNNGELIYEGTFKDNYFWTGTTYSTNYDPSLIKSGLYRMFIGEIFEGEVKNGTGAKVDRGEIIFEGEFENGQYKYGREYYSIRNFHAKKLLYEGPFKDGMRHGNGIVYWRIYDDMEKNKDMAIVFQGELKNGEFWNGQQFPEKDRKLFDKYPKDSSVFIGEIKEGERYTGKLYYTDFLTGVYDVYVEGAKTETYKYSHWKDTWILQE